MADDDGVVCGPERVPVRVQAGKELSLRAGEAVLLTLNQDGFESQHQLTDRLLF